MEVNATARKPMLGGLRLAAHVALRRKVVTISGVRISSDPHVVGRSIRAAVVKGTYELAERCLLESAVRPNDKVLELGAGIGLVGLLATRLAGAGQVVSYEANDLMKPVIEENFRLNGLTPNVIYKAVTAAGGDLAFFRSPNVVSSSMFDRGIIAERVTVETESIDAIVKRVEPDVVIMDVEGSEVELASASGFAGVRDIVVELHPHIIGADRCEYVRKCLIAHGFAFRSALDKNVLYSRS